MDIILVVVFWVIVGGVLIACARETLAGWMTLRARSQGSNGAPAPDRSEAAVPPAVRGTIQATWVRWGEEDARHSAEPVPDFAGIPTEMRWAYFCGWQAGRAGREERRKEKREVSAATRGKACDFRTV